MYVKWAAVQNFVKYHLDRTLTNTNVNLFNDQTISNYQENLKRRQSSLYWMSFSEGDKEFIRACGAS